MSRPMWYILDENKNPVPTDMVGVAKWQFNRRVTLTKIKGVEVSTVFTCLDHDMFGGGPPVLFETMIFAKDILPDLDNYQRRYCTWNEAVFGHDRACVLVYEEFRQQSLFTKIRLYFRRLMKRRH